MNVSRWKGRGSNIFRFTSSSYPNIEAAAAQMVNYRLIVLILVLVELCVIVLGTVIFRCSRRKTNNQKLTDASLCISILIISFMTIAACELSTKAGHQRLFAAFTQSAVGILGIAEVSVILYEHTCVFAADI
jgi:heme/copper-type cytochrome/quinol oxidase subunit 2